MAKTSKPTETAIDAAAEQLAERAAGRLAERILEIAAPRARAVALAGDDVVVDEDEAGAILSASPRTLQHWRRQGSGPRVTKIGARIGYRLADLRAFIRAAAE